MGTCRIAQLVTACAVVAVLAVPAQAQQDFSRAHSLQFRVNSEARALNRETLRANLNAAARAAAGTSQANSNMANVIQNTENYEIVLNGDGNTVNTATGGIKGTQDGAGLGQTADNQVNTHSTVVSARGGESNAGVTVLNP